MPNQFKLFKYFQEVSWPIQLSASSGRREHGAEYPGLISWRRQYHWQAGGPFHYSLIVELKFDEKYW